MQSISFSHLLVSEKIILTFLTKLTLFVALEANQIQQFGQKSYET